VIALLFDLDGVIVDSNPMHRLAWEAFNRQYGLETTMAMHERMYGKRNDEIVRDFFGDAIGHEEIAARGYAKEALYRQMVEGKVEEMLVPGLRDFLTRHRDLPMAVASNAEPANVALFLYGTGLRPFFGAVVDGHQVARPKPFPDIYLRAAEILNLKPRDCIVFEDSFSGVAAGLAAGMPVIGLRTTHDNLPGATLTVDNFLDGVLESWLQSQLRAG
jgi:beta-phosphoglucomutase